MKILKSVRVWALPLATSLLASSAWATHKSWFLQDSGATCQSGTSPPNAFVYDTGAIRNSLTDPWSVVCPVTLAGRFGGNSPIYGFFNMAQWARAREGVVHVNNTSTTSNITCFLYVFSDTGASWYSRSVSSSGTGAQTLQIYDKVNHTWGGGLGSGASVNVRAMGYRCSLPAQSSVYGYSVNICQVGACTL
jgi:hypothetical protein